MQNKSKSDYHGQLHEMIGIDTPVIEPPAPLQDVIEIPEEFRVTYWGISEEEFIKKGGSFAPRCARRD